MLHRLRIQNYAIIDDIEIIFSQKLNIITGETGAGKSILMGALSLILGDRADTSVLLKNDKKCLIEGAFAVSDKLLVQQFLQQHELDNEEELIIRREITNSGKSRSFVNDTPVTLQQLKELAGLLVDLHQQFDTLALGNSNFQREVMDALANSNQQLQLYQSAYKQWAAAKKTLTQLLDQKASFAKELDYNKFLFDELETLNLQPNELEQLEDELKLLSNSEAIKAALAKVYFDCKESEQAIVPHLKQLYHQLSPYQNFHPNLSVVVERLTSVQIELQDIAQEVDTINDAVQYDEKRIDLINEKLAAGYKLLKKHGVLTTEELQTIQNNLADKLQAVLHIDEEISTKETEVRQLGTATQQYGALLTQLRNQQTMPLEIQVNNLLKQVGMPNAQFKVSIKPADLHAYGADLIEFLFDANKSNRFEPIAKVASGGELSRLMLCIKSLVAQSMDLPTMIFDEIDTGISGEAAKQVGLIMKNLSTNRQIICITHQPQMAGKADAHFFVYKEMKAGTVKTNIRLLTENERITAIAQMLSGEKPTAAALENAREMLLN